MGTTAGHRQHNQKEAALRFLLAGGVLFVIGLVIALIAEGGLANGIGAFFMIVACLPTVVGIVLFGSAVIERRSSRGKPFA